MDPLFIIQNVSELLASWTDNTHKVNLLLKLNELAIITLNTGRVDINAVFPSLVAHLFSVLTPLGVCFTLRCFVNLFLGNKG